MNNSRKAQDILKGRIIATSMSLFFLIMGFLTIHSRQLSVTVELNNIHQVMLAQIDFYMGLIQMSLALLPLAVWFNTKKTIFSFMIFPLVLAVFFFICMYSQIM